MLKSIADYEHDMESLLLLSAIVRYETLEHVAGKQPSTNILLKILMQMDRKKILR